MRIRSYTALVIACGIAVLGSVTRAADSPGILKSEFLFNEASFACCHASTLAQTPRGLVAAWFGGTKEGAGDVSIWLSRHDARGWSAPVQVASATDNGRPTPCWNPVLFQIPSGPLVLLYKAGPGPRRWWGEVTQSKDGGTTWAPPRRLPEGFLGPIKNKPVLIGKDLLCPSSTEDSGWQVHLERTPNFGRAWTKTEPLNDGKGVAAIQPTILRFKDRLQILCRTQQKKIYESSSSDQGKTWTALEATGLPNSNSGIDAVNLPDGRGLLVYNHTDNGRSPLNVAVTDDGQRWQAGLELETEPGEFSYPGVICTTDGLVHITYTWKRQRIKHVVVDPAKLALREIGGGEWPAKD